MDIGRRVYYDKVNGNVILDTGERSGDVIETTIDQDFQAYVALSQRTKETVGVVELVYGQYRQDFTSCSGYHVDPVTTTLVFFYPDPNNPEVTIVQPSFEDRVSALEDAVLTLMG